MSQLYFPFLPTMSTGSSRPNLLLNSQNFSPSVIKGAKNPSPSWLCYQSLWENRNKRALSLIARNHGLNAANGKRSRTEDEHNDYTDAAHKRQMISHSDLVKASVIGRPIINCPKTKEIWREFKDKLEESLRKRLRELELDNDFNGMGHELEILAGKTQGLEMVDSLNLLKLFNVSNSEFEAFVQKAGDGEKQFSEGLKQAREGYEKLKLVASDVLNST